MTARRPSARRRASSRSARAMPSASASTGPTQGATAAADRPVDTRSALWRAQAVAPAPPRSL
eukprot:5197121-Alexandrium_andersonii.AAC.1